MRAGSLVASLETLRSAWSAIDFASGRGVELKAAWRCWRNGDVALAEALARQVLAARSRVDEARHLLFLTASVRGKYREALEHYFSIAGSYRRRRQLREPVIDAYVHLAAIHDAAAFARRQGAPAVTVQRLGEHARRPLSVDLAAVTTVPFADHPLTDLLPAFDVAVNGQHVTAHVDTGGTFLLMGPERARSLGIRTVRMGSDRAHLNLMRIDLSYGIADRLVLGNAVLHNVPVDVLSTLTGEGDLVIFGTNLLEQFLSTLDYPKRRLILSKRGDEEAAEAHRMMLPAASTPIPFHLWSDHFMFARGGLGDRQGLNFFVDSGLIATITDGAGGNRQASFASSRRRLRQCGFDAADIRRGCFQSHGPLTLGPLVEERPAIVVGAAGDLDFGGLRIDGLISHAFLKRHVWTIDFDTFEYRFADRREAGQEPPAASQVRF